MNFINPIELLQLQEFDSEAIKKAKRRKLAEIELSDEGYISFYNTHVDKSAFVSITEQLNNSSKLKAFYTLSKHKSLTRFLTGENIDFFEVQEIPSELYDREILNVVSKPFSKELDRQLLKALMEKDTFTVKLLSQHAPLIKSNDLDSGFISAENYLREAISEISSLRNRIDNDNSIYNESNCEGVFYTVKNIIHIPSINVLPQNFQGLRNEIGQKIRNLSVAVFNSFNSVDNSLYIMEYALKIKLDGIRKNNIKKDLDEIKEIQTEREQNSKFEPILQNYASKLLLGRSVIEGINNETHSLSDVKSKMKSFLSTDELNELPELFQEIRNQIALALRGVSVAVWNKFGELEYSQLLLGIALKINVNSDVYENLSSANSKLRDMEDDEYKPTINILTQTNSALKKVPYGQSIDSYKLKTLLNKLLPDYTLESFGKKGGNVLSQFIVQLIPVLTRVDNKYASKKLEIILQNLNSNDSNYSSISNSYEKLKPKGLWNSIFGN